MPRNSEEYPYPSYPENYYDSYQIQHAQQQQQHHHQQQQQQQQQQQHYQQHLPSGYSHAHAAYYAHGHQMQHDYSNQAGPSYYPGGSQHYQVAVEDDYHEESPSPSVQPYEEHSPTYPTFGQFQLDTGSYGENSNIEHIITEHELPAPEVAAYFPASNKTDIHTDKGVIWRCNVCAKEIPARNKIEHIFKHKDQPRYTCSCKAKFARGQDKNRHLKEQALCSECQSTKVGRRGQNGKCQMCL